MSKKDYKIKKSKALTKQRKLVFDHNIDNTLNGYNKDTLSSNHLIKESIEEDLKNLEDLYQS